MRASVRNTDVGWVLLVVFAGRESTMGSVVLSWSNRPAFVSLVVHLHDRFVVAMPVHDGLRAFVPWDPATRFLSSSTSRLSWPNHTANYSQVGRTTEDGFKNAMALRKDSSPNMSVAASICTRIILHNELHLQPLID